MYLVSTRRELLDEDRTGPTTYWSLDVCQGCEDDSTRTKIEPGAFFDRFRQKNVLVLVHGYNNEFGDVVRAYDTIEHKVARFLDDWYDDVIGFTWPGGDNVLDWHAPKRRAGVIGPRLAQFIAQLGPKAYNIDLMSHSLGSRVTLKALSRVKPGAVRASFLMASAIDNESIEPGEKYFDAAKRGAEESVVFHSKHDGVLRTAYRIAEWDNALGLYGPENPAEIGDRLPNVSVANCKHVIQAHGDYKDSDSVYRFIDDWMNGKIKSQFSTVR